MFQNANFLLVSEARIFSVSENGENGLSDEGS